MGFYGHLSSLSILLVLVQTRCGYPHVNVNKLALSLARLKLLAAA